MALSGSTYVNVNSRWRLSIEWSASQDISNNRSTVTSRMYWESLDGYGSVYSSASKSGYISLDGTGHSFSGSAALSGKQKKLVATHTKTISHNSDGSKSFNLSGYFDIAVTLNGTYYGRVSVPNKTFTLNTIPRASTLSSNASWTAGSNKSISISRASSSFTHTVRMYVGGTLVKTATGIGTSVTMSFNTTENTAVFDKLNGAGSMSTEIQIVTYNGGTHIGTTSKTGTVTAPAASTITEFRGEMTTHNNPRDHWTDQTFSFPITRSNSGFTHTIRVYIGSTTIKTLTGVGTSASWTPTAAEKTTMHNLMKTSKVATGGLELTTYYNGEKVRASASAYMYFYIRNAEPTFSSTYLTHTDTNTTTTAITGNSAILIQSRSKLSVTLTGSASGKEGASISRYEVSINGVTKSSSTIGTFVFNEISASGNLGLTVKVTDSRGFTTTVTKTVTVWAYSPPRVTIDAERLGGFEAQTTVGVTGSITPLTGNKNYIRTAQAYYVNKSTGASAGTTNLSVSGYPSFSAAPFVYTLNNQTAFDIVVTIEDVLSTVVHTVTVEVGRPILFIDSEKGSVGIGDFPSGENELLINGRIVFGATQWATNSQGESAIGAIDLNNSDIVKANGLYFNDVSSNRGEGLMFLKSGKPNGSAAAEDYDQFYIRDGVMYMDHGGVTVPSLHIASGDDVHGTSVGRGLVIGSSATSGSRLMFDNNEVSAFNGTSPSSLHINPDGGIVYVGFNSPAAGSEALETNGKITINGNGPNTLDIKANDHAYLQWFVKGGSTRSGYMGWGSAGSDHMNIVNSIGAVVIYGMGGVELAITYDSAGGRLYSRDVYNRTYSFAANMYITSAGTFGRATSASKYKLNIETVDTTDLEERVLYLQPKSWYDRTSSEVYAEQMTKMFNGEEIDEDDEVPFIQRHYGLIAEDLVDLGLEMYVQYGEPDEQGHREVEGIQYDRIWTLLIPVVRKQRDKIQSLEERIFKLENQK